MARKGSGLGERMAAKPMDAVAAGMEAALGVGAGQAEVSEKGPVVAFNIRLPKPMHRELRQIAFDQETSINALLIEAVEKMLAARKG